MTSNKIGIRVRVTIRVTGRCKRTVRVTGRFIRVMARGRVMAGARGYGEGQAWVAS